MNHSFGLYCTARYNGLKMTKKMGCKWRALLRGAKFGPTNNGPVSGLKVLKEHVKIEINSVVLKIKSKSKEHKSQV